MFEERYHTNPVESPDRIRLRTIDLENEGHEFVKPQPDNFEEIHRVHGVEHVEIVQRRGLYNAAALAAGDAICAAEIALNLLRTEDYREIGRIIREGSIICGGRRFAVLEGGYHPDLRYNIMSFINGFQ